MSRTYKSQTVIIDFAICRSKFAVPRPHFMAWKYSRNAWLRFRTYLIVTCSEQAQNATFHPLSWTCVGTNPSLSKAKSKAIYDLHTLLLLSIDLWIWHLPWIRPMLICFIFLSTESNWESKTLSFEGESGVEIIPPFSSWFSFSRWTTICALLSRNAWNHHILGTFSLGASIDIEVDRCQPWRWVPLLVSRCQLLADCRGMECIQCNHRRSIDCSQTNG